MMHVPRGGRPPWDGGGRWPPRGPVRPPWGGGRPILTPWPPRDRFVGRPPWQGGGWGRPMPPWAGGGGWGRPPRRPWGSNPFNPFGPRQHPRDLMALLQKQMEARNKFNQAVRDGNKALPQIAQAVPMQVAELSSAGPATTTVTLPPPPPRRPRIAVDPVRRRRMYPSVVRNKGGLMKRRYA